MLLNLLFLSKLKFKKNIEIKTVYFTGQILFSIHLIYLIKKIYTQWGKSQSMKPKNSKFCFDLFVFLFFFVPMSSSQNWEIVKTHITGKHTDNRNIFKIPHTGVIFEIFFFRI